MKIATTLLIAITSAIAATITTLPRPGLTAHPLSEIETPLELLPIPISSTDDDFSPTLSANGLTLIFNSRRGGRYQNLFISERPDIESDWSRPQPLTTLNSPYNDETPFLTPDGGLLLFASDRDGSTEMPADSLGRVRISFDLYWSRRNADGSWGPAQRLPGAVNTMHHERSPSLDGRGNLYFNRWPFGDPDRARIFVSRWQSRTFRTAEPLPEQINAGHRDAGFIPAGSDGYYFASERPGGMGGWDLYYVEYDGEKFGEPERLGEPFNSESNDIYLTHGGNYAILSSNRPGGPGRYSLYAFRFTPQRDEVEERLRGLREGESIELTTIHFDGNSHMLRPESFEVLERIVAFMKRNPGTHFTIVGHTDLHGPHFYNDQLSRRRADAVRQYLVSRGIDGRRLVTMGAGKRHPVRDEISPESDALNRRTEFRLMQRRLPD